MAAVFCIWTIHPALFIFSPPCQCLTGWAFNYLVLAIVFKKPDRKAVGVVVFFLRRDDCIYTFLLEMLIVLAVCIAGIRWKSFYFHTDITLDTFNLIGQLTAFAILSCSDIDINNNTASIIDGSIRCLWLDVVIVASGSVVLRFLGLGCFLGLPRPLGLSSTEAFSFITV